MVTSLSQCAVFTFLKRAGVAALAMLIAAPSFGDIIYTGTSVVASGTAANGLGARATFTVSPTDSNVLQLLLENISAGPTMAPSELLTSVYFNVLSGTTTGTPAPLSFANATGYVYLALKSMADKPAKYVPPITSGSAVSYPATPELSNLQAFNANDNTWQFRSGMSLVASEPPLAFGVGTAGNANVTPNNFNGSIVDGFDFGLYKGDVTTQNLNNTLLVKDFALFEFAGFGSYKLSQVSPHVVFGFGTNPEVIISVPEPDALVLAAFGLIAGIVTERRLRGSRPKSVQGTNALETCGA